MNINNKYTPALNLAAWIEVVGDRDKVLRKLYFEVLGTPPPGQFPRVHSSRSNSPQPNPNPNPDPRCELTGEKLTRGDFPDTVLW